MLPHVALLAMCMDAVMARCMDGLDAMVVMVVIPIFEEVQCLSRSPDKQT